MKKGKNRFFSSCFFSRLVLQKKKEGWGLARPFSFHFSLSLSLLYTKLLLAFHESSSAPLSASNASPTNRLP